jgi:hypothetical protein
LVAGCLPSQKLRQVNRLQVHPFSTLIFLDFLLPFFDHRSFSEGGCLITFAICLLWGQDCSSRQAGIRGPVGGSFTKKKPGLRCAQTRFCFSPSAYKNRFLTLPGKTKPAAFATGFFFVAGAGLLFLALKVAKIKKINTNLYKS